MKALEAAKEEMLAATSSGRRPITKGKGRGNARGRGRGSAKAASSAPGAGQYDPDDADCENPIVASHSDLIDTTLLGKIGSMETACRIDI